MAETILDGCVPTSVSRGPFPRSRKEPVLEVPRREKGLALQQGSIQGLEEMEELAGAQKWAKDPLLPAGQPVSLQGVQVCGPSRAVLFSAIAE